MGKLRFPVNKIILNILYSEQGVRKHLKFYKTRLEVVC